MQTRSMASTQPVGFRRSSSRATRTWTHDERAIDRPQQTGVTEELLGQLRPAADAGQHERVEEGVEQEAEGDDDDPEREVLTCVAARHGCECSRRTDPRHAAGDGTTRPNR